MNRPDVQELLRLAKASAFDKVVITEISRLGRNAADLKYIIEMLHSYGVSIVFKNLGIESMDNGVPSFAIALLLAIHAEITQEEVRTLSSRIKSGLDHARKKGKRIGRPEGLMTNDELLKRYPGMVRDIKAGISVRKTAAIHDVCQTTVMKVKRAITA